MGITDEHYCSDCKKDLDKTKDKYVEAEFPNNKEPGRSNRVFLCEKCAKKSKVTIAGKKVSVWQFMRSLRHRGNPTFECGIHCYAAPICQTYRARKGRVNCAHIAVTPEGRVYCKRNHPGFIVLPQEKAAVEHSRFESILNYTRRMAGAAGVGNLKNVMQAFGLDPVHARKHKVSPVKPVGEDVTKKAPRALGGKS